MIYIPELETAAAILENLEENFTMKKTGSRPERQLFCQGEACRKALKEVIGELFSHYEKPFLQKDKVDRHSAQCLSEFVQLKQMERGFSEGLNIPNVKRNFSKKGLKNFSASTRKSFENYINNDFHIGPLVPKPQDFKALLETRFSNEWEMDTSEEFDNKDIEGDNTKLIAEMYQERLASEESWNSPCPVKSPKGKSRDIFLPPEFIEESVQFTSQHMKDIPAKGAVGLSLFSCLHPHHGQGIASHEMGHLLSWMFVQKKLSNKSYGPYKKLRECATKRYKTLKSSSEYPLEFIHANDQLKTEEDTADLMSYLVIQDSKTHYSCSLLDITDNGAQYKGFGILNNTVEDFHSNSFLRLLFEAIHKRVELSPACQAVVNQYKNEINFKPCF